MVKEKLEYAVLKSFERMSRRDALGCKVDPEPPWPKCTIILHQPKRPKKI